jgi:CheY-like chemotaxis protein
MSQRILVVEDDEDNITIIADILKLVLHQRELLFARNGHEAIRMAQQYRPDLILMDLTLPDLSGRQIPGHAHPRLDCQRHGR